MRKGFAPAKDVADATGKHLTTIHRLAAADAFEHVRDGRALYVNLASVITYFKGADLPMLADAVARVARAVERETKGLAL